MITSTQIGSDCILYEGRAEEVLPLLQTESVDLTVTSPPYDKLRTYNGNSAFDFEKVAQELFRVTKQGGVVVWVVGDSVINGGESGTSFRQALGFMGIGFTLHDTMIYWKNSFTFPESNRYAQNFEYMFVLSKGKPKTANITRVPTNQENRIKHKSSNYRKADGKTVPMKYETGKDNRAMENIWAYECGFMKTTKDVSAFKHPAMFPERLAVDHIESWSNEDEIVLDCFAGSGTTGKAAKLRRRKSILIEVDSSSISLIKERLSNTQPLFDQSVPAMMDNK